MRPLLSHYKVGKNPCAGVERVVEMSVCGSRSLRGFVSMMYYGFSPRALTLWDSRTTSQAKLRGDPRSVPLVLSIRLGTWFARQSLQD